MDGHYHCFNVLECCKVRKYDLSHISKLVEKQIYLTPNQLIIYQNSIMISTNNIKRKKCLFSLISQTKINKILSFI